MSGFDTDDIIRMAQDVGAARLHSTGNIIFGVNALEHFVLLVAAAEREACAKLCERGNPLVKPAMTQHQCAAAIRARGNNAA